MKNCQHDIHAELDPITCWVDQRVFFNMQGNREWVKAKLFGISCLPGKVPCFEIITPEGFIFSDIPPHLIRFSIQNETHEFELSELVYNNCLSTHFSIATFGELEQRKMFAYVKQKNTYMEATYWFSLDFYQNNNWYHALKLKNGQIGFFPSHKIVAPIDGKLPENHVFPKYQKLRQEFKV